MRGRQWCEGRETDGWQIWFERIWQRRRKLCLNLSANLPNDTHTYSKSESEREIGRDRVRKNVLSKGHFLIEAVNWLNAEINLLIIWLNYMEISGRKNTWNSWTRSESCKGFARNDKILNVIIEFSECRINKGQTNAIELEKNQITRTRTKTSKIH